MLGRIAAWGDIPLMPVAELLYSQCGREAAGVMFDHHGVAVMDRRMLLSALAATGRQFSCPPAQAGICFREPTSGASQ